MKFMRIGLFSVLTLGLLISSAYAQESVTVTTYYPSPYGSYNAISTNSLKFGRLPKAPSDCNADNEGVIYYNNIVKKVVLCVADGQEYVWRILSAWPVNLRDFGYGQKTGNNLCKAHNESCIVVYYGNAQKVPCEADISSLSGLHPQALCSIEKLK